MTAAITDAHLAIAQMRPMLAGKPPAVQSIILADLLATWVVGHTPEVRTEALELHLQLVRDLIPHNEREIFGERGWRG